MCELTCIIHVIDNVQSPLDRLITLMGVVFHMIK